jgi:hypothetical protein
MRFGMSWPTGRGRRQWVSYGPVGVAVLFWVWIAVWLVWAALAIVYWTVYGLVWVAGRPVVAWRARHPAASS